MKGFLKIVLIIAFVVFFGIMGNEEQKQEERDRQFYIETYGIDYTIK